MYEGRENIKYFTLCTYDCTDKLSKYVAKKGQLWNFGVSKQLFAWICRKCTIKSNLLLHFLSSISTSVMRLGSDTFGDPIFQNGLQNKPSSQIISIQGCFAYLCQLSTKCKNWTFKVNFLCQKSSETPWFFFH